MAYRDDISIDWSVSPRVITIASPSVECSMQDLLDTLRTLESSPDAMANKPIVDASGKETLDSSTKVGLTVTLQNALVGFEARGAEPFVGCSFVGGNLVAVNDIGVSVNPLQYTSFVSLSRTSSSSATVSQASGTTPDDFVDVLFARTISI